MRRAIIVIILAALLCLGGLALHAQDLDPRAYAKVPVDMTVLVAGFSYSDGSVVTDPTAPIQNLQAVMRGATLAVGHTFSLFGQTAQVLASQSYVWGLASGTVLSNDMYGEKGGFGDLRVRLSTLFYGAPATERANFKPQEHNTVLGASVMVQAPTGMYEPDKLINIGNNRWALKPELAFSQPFGERVLLDVYAGVWFFTTNDAYYPGTSERKQNTMPVIQAHVSYTVQPALWVAFDATYYVGGRSTVNGVLLPDEQNNVRVGGTLVVPVVAGNSIKLAASTGAIVRGGANFTTLSLAWQTTIY
ncbi:MAG: transporter [Bacteroidetes bacterium]|nr:transporter [Bacteroidota bacterium]